MTIELYELPGCPFCERVRSVLDELDLEYVSHEVPAFRGDRDEVAAISGQRGVPVLVDTEHGIEAMPESSEITRFLRETYA